MIKADMYASRDEAQITIAAKVYEVRLLATNTVYARYHQELLNF